MPVPAFRCHADRRFGHGKNYIDLIFTLLKNKYLISEKKLPKNPGVLKWIPLNYLYWPLVVPIKIKNNDGPSLPLQHGLMYKHPLTWSIPGAWLWIIYIWWQQKQMISNLIPKNDVYSSVNHPIWDDSVSLVLGFSHNTTLHQVIFMKHH